jgi:hypothetical protein
MRYLILVCALLIALPALAVDYLGTDVTFGWTQGAGSTPEGYTVWVARNGAAPSNEQTVTAPQATISGAVDETIIVSVQAFIGALTSGMSESSDPVTFRVLQAPTGVQIKCPDGQAFQEIGGGWWSCR